MSDEEKNNDNDPKKLIGNLVAALSGLKESNPKVLYGGVGGFVLLVLILMMGGGEDAPIAPGGPSASSLVIGQTYILKEANTYDPESVVRLVVTPGSLKAYDDTDKADREGCKNIKQGTQVTLLEFFDAYGKQRTYSKVKVKSGVCKDYVGWTLSMNVK